MGLLQPVRFKVRMPPASHDFHRTFSEYGEATLEDWTGILKISKTYRFTSVKALAVRFINQLGVSVIERIRLYEEYDVDPSFIVPLYKTFVDRSEPLTDDEITSLGQKTTILILRARERARSQPGGTGRIPLPDNVGEGQVISILCTLLSVDPSTGVVTTISAHPYIAQSNCRTPVPGPPTPSRSPITPQRPNGRT